MDVEGIKTIM